MGSRENGGKGVEQAAWTSLSRCFSGKGSREWVRLSNAETMLACSHASETNQWARGISNEEGER